MTALDTRAGTHFTTEKIFVTPHALDECTKDFGIERSKAPMYVMSQLRRATFIDNIVSDDGRPTRLFAYQRMAIAVAMDEPTVLTVYPRHEVCASLRHPIEKLITKMLRSAQRHEKTESKRIGIAKAELGIERATCLLRIERSSSIKAKAGLYVKVGEIDRKVSELDAELIVIKREKAKLCKGIVAYL